MCACVGVCINVRVCVCYGCMLVFACEFKGVCVLMLVFVCVTGV
jgi:hypothetical protein